MRPFKRRGGPRQAGWGDVVVARAEATTKVDGREYFPADGVDWSRSEKTSETTVCPWKGVATYYDVVDGEHRLKGAAWVYENPKPAAAHLAGQVAYWRGVDVGPESPSD